MAQNIDATASTSDEASVQYPFTVRDTICEHLYLNPEMSDVQFIFPSKGHQLETGEQRAKRAKKSTVSIPAHKLFLKTGSKVFREMFNGTWKEKKEVEIVDATPEAFKEFLQCFYLGSGQFSKENIDQVMYLADKYDIENCFLQCVQFVKDSMTLDDVCSGYALSILYKQPELKVMCEEMITFNAKAVMNSDDFLVCKRDTLAEILKLNLSCRETTVLDGCMKWTKNACKNNGLDKPNIENLRAQLGECLFLIRFGHMTLEELCQHTLNYSGLLRGDELEDAVRCIGLEGYTSKKFVQIPRLCWNECKIWQCRTKYSISKKCLQSIETVQISSNKTTLLGGLYGKPLRYDATNIISLAHHSTTASIEIIKKKSAPEEILFTGTIHFNGIRGDPLKFAEPIVIEEGVKYEIRLGFNEHLGASVYPILGGKVESPKGLQIDFDANGGTHFIDELTLMDV